MGKGGKGSAKGRSRPRWLGWLLGSAGVLAVVLAVVGVMTLTRQPFRLKIGGTPVAEAEFEMALSRVNYQVTLELEETYGLTQAVNLWTAEAGGRPAYELLADRAVEELAQRAKIYRLAKETGLVEGISYYDFLDRMDAENARRVEAAAKGESVYGLTHFTAEIFWDYELRELERALEETLGVSQTALEDTLGAMEGDVEFPRGPAGVYAFTKRRVAP